MSEIILRLYEHNPDGKICGKRFTKMTASCEAGQTHLETCVDTLRRQMEAEKDEALNVGSFLSLVRKYTGIQELSVEIIRKFIGKIYIHQAERIGGQRIRIVWNNVGEFTPPAQEQKEVST